MVSDLVIVAVIAAVPSTITSLASWRQSKRNARDLQIVRHEVDGKMTKLIDALKSQAEAQTQLAAQFAYEAGKRAEASGKRRATDKEKG